MSALGNLSNISDSDSFEDLNSHKNGKISRKHSKSKRSKERRKGESYESEKYSQINDYKHSSKVDSTSLRKEHRHKKRKRNDHSDSEVDNVEVKHEPSDSDSDEKYSKHSSRHKRKKNKHKHKKRKEERSRSSKENKQANPEVTTDSPSELHPSLSNASRSKWEDDNHLQAVKVEENPSLAREFNSNDNMETGADQETEEKALPNLGLSGKLAEDANTYKGVVIKYSQPSEARKPKRRWRWYIFKGDEELPFLPIHKQSAYLIGRERRICDIPTDHPSCSKQHAVLQYRLVRYTKEDGNIGKTVKPYIIDLESANGTYVNNKRITTRSYVELMEKDVVKFGYSSREYVLLHETSKNSDEESGDGGLDMSPVSALLSLQPRRNAL